MRLGGLERNLQTSTSALRRSYRTPTARTARSRRRALTSPASTPTQTRRTRPRTTSASPCACARLRSRSRTASPSTERRWGICPWLPWRSPRSRTPPSSRRASVSRSPRRAGGAWSKTTIKTVENAQRGTRRTTAGTRRRRLPARRFDRQKRRCQTSASTSTRRWLSHG